MRPALALGLVATLSLGLQAPALAAAPTKGEFPDPFVVADQIQGETFTNLRALRGKVVILSFFANDEMCAEVARVLEKAWQAHKDHGLVVIGIAGERSAKNTKASLKQFIRDNGVSYPVLRSQDAFRCWEIPGVPGNVILGPSGKCAVYEGDGITKRSRLLSIDEDGLKDLLSQVDLEALAASRAIPKAEYSKKFDAIRKSIDDGDFKAASAGLAKLEKDQGPDGENAKALAKWIHERGLSRLDDAEEALKAEDYIAAKEILEEIKKRWPDRDDVVATARDKVASLEKDKTSNSAKVLGQEKEWRTAQKLAAGGESKPARETYFKASRNCPGTKFWDRCEDRIVSIMQADAEAER